MAKMTHPESKFTIDVEPERQAMYLSQGWRFKAASKTTVTAQTGDK